MTESVQERLQALSFLISAFAAYWVFQDDKRLRRDGANLSPALWALLVLLLWLVSLPA